jgi:hypothetical protein
MDPLSFFLIMLGCLAGVYIVWMLVVGAIFGKVRDARAPA